jgi:hypothetical protein
MSAVHWGGRLMRKYFAAKNRTALWGVIMVAVMLSLGVSGVAYAGQSTPDQFDDKWEALTSQQFDDKWEATTLDQFTDKWE